MSDEKKMTLELTHDELVFVQDLVDLGTLSHLTNHGKVMNLESIILRESLAQRIKAYAHKLGNDKLMALSNYLDKVHDEFHDAADVEGFLKELHKHE